jgi:non-specific serine/threonine protein kinase/serine/threonine-protein kinase
MKSQPDAARPDPVRLQQLFHTAADLPEKEQLEYLARECPEGGPEYQAVLSLLAAERSPPTAWRDNAFELEARTTAAHSGQARVGQFFGPYRILRHISTGGMGFVYEAVRADDQYQKKVAIKIVQKSVDDSAGIIERFRGERQILARLEHPNIARLLEGGTTGDGVPYLVMEYVDGVPLNRYASEHALTIHESVKLFLMICDAVQYAHRNLVVHRDLKPSNILVTAEGIPKLLDFGIAKLLHAEGAALTATVGAMTLEYASPEQILGALITTSSDIYSLGVLLYEMLSGRRPYRNVTSAMELTRAICTDAPVPLSTRTGPAFDLDLENIVQMALRKEPERRYPAVGQFAEDLRRYLDGYPVSARTDTRGYRAVKFIGRNKAAMLAGSLGVLALLAGIATTSWEAHVADRRFNDVRKLANSYLFEFHDAIKDLPGSTPARQLVVKRALEYLDLLSQERGNDAGLSSELANAYKKVGDVQGMPLSPSLGDKAGALASYRKAVAILERLSAAHPLDTGILTALGECYVNTALILQHSADLDGASESSRKAVRLMEKAEAAHPSDVKVREILANAYTQLGDVLGNYNETNLGDTAGAVECFHKAIALREKLVKENPRNLEGRVYLASIYARLGVIRRARADNPGAVAALRNSLAIEEQLAREDPVTWLYRREVAVDSRTLSLLFRDMGDLEQAQTYGDRSAGIFAQLASEDARNTQAQEELADSDYSQGSILAKRHDRVGAQAHYDSALSGYGRVMQHDPGNFPYGLNSTYQLIAALAIETGDSGKALRAAAKEVQIADRLLAINLANETARRNQGVAFMQMGQAHELLAKTQRAEWPEARSWYQKSLDIWLDLRKKGTLIPRYAPRLDEAGQAVARCDRVIATGALIVHRGGLR